jgi:hypothetical protein
MQAFKGAKKGKVHRRKLLGVKEGRGEQLIADSSRMVTEKGGTGRFCPWATIDVLPDNVLLETFEFYLGKDPADEFDHGQNYDKWQTLVHVCSRWRSIMFASPRRLDLKLYCTRQHSVNSKMLDIWPAFPIVIYATQLKSEEDVTNIIGALRHHNRVCKIYHSDEHQQDSPLLKEFAAIDEPFPALTSLQLSNSQGQNVTVLPDSFLGGSAPRLLSLNLDGIPYPSIGKLLSSTTNLTRLILWNIPHSGHISPKTIVSCLSMLPRLESLHVGFQHPRSEAHRANRHPPPLTRVVRPNLTSLFFHGDIEYLEDILSHIEIPTLNLSSFHFFNQLVFDTPLLGHFIRRTETLKKIHGAHVQFMNSAVLVSLLDQEAMANGDIETLQLVLSCKPLDWQLSAVAQVLNSFLSSLPTLESLKIEVFPKDWQDEIEVIQWRELLRSFTSVKDMTLDSENSIQLVALALQELSVEREIEELPALQNIFLRTKGWLPSGPVKEAMEQFIATRQLSGHPVTVHYN